MADTNIATVDSRYHEIAYYDMLLTAMADKYIPAFGICSPRQRLQRQSSYIDTFIISHLYRNNGSLLYLPNRYLLGRQIRGFSV